MEMMGVYEYLNLFWRFGIFCCQYGFSKCMKTMFCGLLVMLPLLVWHCRRQGKSGRIADLGFYGWFLLFPAALMGMSKLFYQRWSIWLQNGISILGKTWVSSVYFAVLLALAGWWLTRKRLLARKTQKLPCWYSLDGKPHGGTKDWWDCVRKVTDSDRWKLACRYLRRVRVYISSEGGSPFCGGIFRPYIVMPDICLEPDDGRIRDVERTRNRKQNRSGEQTWDGRRIRSGEQTWDDRRIRGGERTWDGERIRDRKQNRSGERTWDRERIRDGEQQAVCADYENWRLTPQGRVLLCHELLHLKSGHILWINLFALLRIYWWCNPLVYLCERLLQQDMEKACDEACLYYTDTGEREYGRMLLDMAARQEPVRPAGAATFLNDRDYRSLRSRIGNLRGKGGWKQYRKLHKCMSRVCAVTLVLGVLAVGAFSYPRYTRMPDLFLYDGNLRLLCKDSPQLREAVRVVDGYLEIDGERMEDCLKELDIEGEYVYLSYGTIMKVPGVGGCGNVGMIELGNYEDIFYLRAETWGNDFMEFCLKYLL